MMTSRKPTIHPVKKGLLKSPIKRKQWNALSMGAAMQAVREGMSIQAAATKHDVPKTSLYHRVVGKVRHGDNPGQSCYLSAVEEKELVDFLLLTARIGYHKTRAEVTRIVESIACDKKILRTDRLSNGWVASFLKRHPEVKLRHELNAIRMDEEAMKSYFEELKKILDECNLNSAPMQIYTADETVLSNEYHISSLEGIEVQREAIHSKFQVTVIGCVNAMGRAVPPLVIFDNETIHSEWKAGEVPGTTYKVSSNGWIDTKIFHGWFRNDFLKNAVSARPLLLLLDGHSFHYQPSFIQLARDENVIVFCLPPDTLDVSQPHHASLYGPTLKAYWHLACFDYMQDNPGKVVTKFQFSTLLNEVWTKTMTPDNIGFKFRTCGIYPYNPNASATDPNHSETTDNCEDMEASDCQRDKATNEGDDEVHKRRYHEGYNTFDESYYAWLQANHLEYATKRHVTTTELHETSNAETSTIQSTANDEVEAGTTQCKAHAGSCCYHKDYFKAHVEAGTQTSIFHPITCVEAETQTITSQSTPNDELYRRRYEEGDKFDENYYTWLQVNHPEDAAKWHQTIMVLQPPNYS